MNSSEKRNYFILLAAAVIVSGLVGGLAGFMAADSTARSTTFVERLEEALTGRNQLFSDRGQYVTPDQSSIVSVVEQASPAVVSIIITKDLPAIDGRSGSDSLRDRLGEDIYEEFFGELDLPDPRDETETRQVGGGSGFIVSSDGLIVTNKHVVADESADYTVLLANGDRHAARVLARDPSNDMAILKIDASDLPVLEFGNSDELKPGQSVIAIGNALSEYSNTVSTGVVSGLARNVTAFSHDLGSEELSGLIQTDASVNLGNSGGPLLDTTGRVIGINVAVARDAQNIGFAIPINQVKTAIDSVRENGRLIRAWLGVRYIILNRDIAETEKLDKDYGALVVRGDAADEAAVLEGSPAEKAGLQEHDIILEANNERISRDNPLALIIARAKPGDRLALKVWREGKEIELTATLEEMK